MSTQLTLSATAAILAMAAFAMANSLGVFSTDAAERMAGLGPVASLSAAR